MTLNTLVNLLGLSGGISLLIIWLAGRFCNMDMNVPRCKCGSDKIIYYNNLAKGTHTGRLDCASCGCFLMWASENLAHFIERLERGGMA